MIWQPLNIYLLINIANSSFCIVLSFTLVLQESIQDEFRPEEDTEQQEVWEREKVRSDILRIFGTSREPLLIIIWAKNVIILRGKCGKCGNLRNPDHRQFRSTLLSVFNVCDPIHVFVRVLSNCCPSPSRLYPHIHQSAPTCILLSCAVCRVPLTFLHTYSNSSPALLTLNNCALFFLSLLMSRKKVLHLSLSLSLSSPLSLAVIRSVH